MYDGNKVDAHSHTAVFCSGDQSQHGSIIACNVICLVIATLFFLIELVQLNGMGAADYFNDYQNKFDFSWFFVQLAYSIFRIVKTDNILPLELYWNLAQEANVYRSINDMFFLAVMNTFLIFYILSKCMFFLTVYKNFGTMIRLV